jgi:hypothetical protein
MRGRETAARSDVGLWTAADRAAGAVHRSWRLIVAVGAALGEAR